MIAAAKSIMVYAYGCAAPLAGREHLEREHARCVAFWNQLVTIDAAIEAEAIARAAEDMPAIAAANEHISALTAILAADPDATAARAERRALYNERKTLLKKWRRGQREWLRELERRRISAVVAARQAVSSLSLRPINAALDVERERLADLSQQQEICDCLARIADLERQRNEAANKILLWMNYNRVLRSYDTARQLTRQFGRRLRPHDESRDDGVIALQFRCTRSGLGAAPAELFDGTVADLQISSEPLPDRRASLLEMRVDADGHTVRLPVWLHRTMPSDARVKAAELVWQRKANRMIWRLCLTLSVPATPLQLTSVESLRAPIRVALWWTLTDTGALRVATAGNCEWSLSAEWMRRYELIATRERWLKNEIKTIRNLYGSDARWSMVLAKSSVTVLFDAMQARWEELPTDLREWYRAARGHRRATAGLREHVLGERHHHYHRIAREIVRLGAVIELPEINLAKIARELRDDDENSLRHRAAIHTLAAMIHHQASKIGCRVLANADAIDAPPTEKSSSWERRKASKLANADNSAA